MTHPPGAPAELRGRLHERARWEWRCGDPGDPFALLEGFLDEAGLPVADLSRPEARRPGAPVGAALLLGGGVSPELWATGPPAPCPEVPDVAAVVYGVAPHARAARRPAGRLGSWQASWSAADHRAAVSAVREAIARGDLYQANIVGHQWAPYDGDPQAVDDALSAVPDAPYAGSLAGEGWSVHSVSPELFLHVADGVARTRPIKGTAPRSTLPDSDRAARRGLRYSAKDRAEHVMIVDLARNDLGRVARTGGVTVRELYAVRPLAGLWHAESTVSADLAAGVGLADLLAALHPGGSVTGAPKLAALAEIARREPVGRGPAMGALGWLGAAGTLDLALTIRTVARAGGRLHLWAGGGVTWGSDPAAEVTEAADKAAPLLAALSRLAATRSGHLTS